MLTLRGLDIIRAPPRNRSWLRLCFALPQLNVLTTRSGLMLRPHLPSRPLVALRKSVLAALLLIAMTPLMMLHPSLVLLPPVIVITVDAEHPP